MLLDEYVVVVVGWVCYLAVMVDVLGIFLFD